MDLKIDPTTGDLELDGAGDVAVVTGADAIAQHVRVRLAFYRGEWFLNQREGMPWYEELLGKGVDLARVKALFLAAILETPGVASVPIFEFNDQGGRRWTLSFDARTDAGEVLQFTDFVVGG